MKIAHRRTIFKDLTHISALEFRRLGALPGLLRTWMSYSAEFELEPEAPGLFFREKYTGSISFDFCCSFAQISKRAPRLGRRLGIRRIEMVLEELSAMGARFVDLQPPTNRLLP